MFRHFTRLSSKRIVPPNDKRKKNRGRNLDENNFGWNWGVWRGIAWRCLSSKVSDEGAGKRTWKK
ncbi:unnamed protein product [Nezara viridula]|uniref:Uncharacterized protein n=1 Tax=Nezara viridula TaxID=85310 RepID=A0A9P0HB95_NEZVI|nr:unnamed protein product [Nezara viridula]